MREIGHLTHHFQDSEPLMRKSPAVTPAAILSLTRDRAPKESGLL
jgi:hypothetical protein